MRGLALGLAIAMVVLSCSRNMTKGPTKPPDWVVHMEKMQVVNGLWLQIRDIRGDMGMELEPSPTTIAEIQLTRTVKDAKKVCPDAQQNAATCEDTCILAEHICDNAETICSIADELGKDDQPAQDKCVSAKASCREAKQRCCNCNAKPPAAGETRPAP
ncbi:MAG: hypothetical protein ABI867_05675 [Kofleriaceae bacterium]